MLEQESIDTLLRVSTLHDINIEHEMYESNSLLYRIARLKEEERLLEMRKEELRSYFGSRLVEIIDDTRTTYLQSVLCDEDSVFSDIEEDDKRDIKKCGVSPTTTTKTTSSSPFNKYVIDSKFVTVRDKKKGNNHIKRLELSHIPLTECYELSESLSPTL